MIAFEEALKRILAEAAPLPAETVGVAEAFGRVLAEDLAARVSHPPVAVSAMDGYAVRAADIAAVPVTLRQTSAVAAGDAPGRPVGAGECARIFTGAPLPPGADTIVIQENAEAKGESVTVLHKAAKGRYVRPAGLDFAAGDVLLQAGRRLTARDIGLVAAMNIPWMRVRRRPRVAVLATGNEIAMPGEDLSGARIVGSNSLALRALVESCGGEAVDLGIAPDDRDTLGAMADGARGCDLLLTTGGASVGDHDLVRSTLGAKGLDLAFWKIAMRPGKPLMFGRLGEIPLIGLPGNPVSTLICGLLFVGPFLRALTGLPPGPATEAARLGADLPANDERRDHLRASLAGGVATPFSRQDSSMMARLAEADCLIVRPVHAPPARAGDEVEIISFGTGEAGL
ncbi:gephyrin-like molybdotransferase Glp [Inquilinus sp. CAU 1745]|uniref:molybdopterin molybdotransferase MoeA n=1 Tax=Inquilinus sp. CAU 1745 TaxID=3140369 RepID=UPI00325C0A41